MRLFRKIIEYRYFTLSLFIFYILIQFLVNGRYGWNDSDEGFIYSRSWRIFNGQLPYRDFIINTTPLSDFLHSISLFIIPDNYQIIFERLLFYIFLAASSYFAAATIDHVFKITKIGLDKYLLATIGFAFSLWNWPPGPWYTVDAVLFSSIGVFLIVRYEKIEYDIIGILCLFLAALCKQTFSLMPLVGLLFIIIHNKNWKRIVFPSISLVVYLAVFILLLSKFNMLNNFQKYTSSVASNHQSLLRAGFYIYIFSKSMYFIIPFFFWILLKKISNTFNTPSYFSFIPYIFISLLLFYNMPRFIKILINEPGDYFHINYYDDAARILLILTFFYILLNYSKEIKWSSLFLLIIISWSSSISFGAQLQTPAFFSTPLVFGFFMVSNQYFNIKNQRKLIYFVLALATFVYFISNQKNIYNNYRSKCTYDLGIVFPKLKYIKADKETFQQHVDLKKLCKKYPGNFKTMPGMPLANYLTNTISTFPVDLVQNMYMIENYNNALLDNLNKTKPFIFIERKNNFLPMNNSNDPFNCPIAFYILNNWNKIDSTEYFYVYKLPDTK